MPSVFGPLPGMTRIESGAKNNSASSARTTVSPLGYRHPEAIEATDEVFDGPLSRAIDQAENRMHTIKALMVSTV